MLVNYFKFKNISKRGRIIALSALGGVFILVSLLALWQNNFADTLIGYAPEDTVFYAHFSRPKLNDPAKIDQILNLILEDLSWPSYQSLAINREVAVVARLQDNGLAYGLIFKTSRPAQAQKVLSAANLKFQALSYNSFFVVSDNWLGDYRPDKNRRLSKNISKRFYPLSSINIYATPAFFSAYSSETDLNMIQSLLKNENNDLIISFKAQGQKLKMFSGGLSLAVKAKSQFPAGDLPFNINSDFVLASADFYALVNNWKNNLKNISAADYQLWTDSRLSSYLNSYLLPANRQVFLLVKKNNNNFGRFWGDYDFYVSVENMRASKIEEILKNIMAESYPTAKNIYLSDGTKVRELVIKPEQFYFKEKNGLKYLSAPDDKFQLFYRLQDQHVIISNSEELIQENLAKSNFNYFHFNPSFLPPSGLGRYLRLFEFLEVSQQGLVLK